MNLGKCRIDLFLQYFVVTAAVLRDCLVWGFWDRVSHIPGCSEFCSRGKGNLELLILCESVHPPPRRPASARMTGAPHRAYFLSCLESAPKCSLWLHTGCHGRAQALSHCQSGFWLYQYFRYFKHLIAGFYRRYSTYKILILMTWIQSLPELMLKEKWIHSYHPLAGRM